MDENSAVISVQKNTEGWIWSISSEDVLRHGVKKLQESNRTFDSYENALEDAQIVFNDLAYS